LNLWQQRLPSILRQRDMTHALFKHSKQTKHTDFLPEYSKQILHRTLNYNQWQLKHYVSTPLAANKKNFNLHASQ
jgi:hypothetical protein